MPACALDSTSSHNGTTDSEFLGHGLHYDSGKTMAQSHILMIDKICVYYLGQRERIRKGSAQK